MKRNNALRDSSMERAIESVIGEMTLEEKIAMIHGAGLFRTGSVERLGIPSLKISDGPMGVRAEFENACWRNLNCNDDFVTWCPSNTAIAATWNPALAELSGEVLGEEARGRGKDMILAPGINVQRVPECGRNFEYFSEDPCLIAKMAVPMIRGIQKSDVAACVKHFALNQQETERLWVNVEASEEALRELYLPGFEAAVKEGGVHSVMGAYNLLRGEHCCENRELLDGILRKEWGFDGIVISDWGAVHHTDAAAKASLDIEMSVTPDFDEYCMAAPLALKVRSGEIAEEVINNKAANILRTMIRIHAVKLSSDGRMEKDISRKPGSYNTQQHHLLVRKAAEESIVLLKNEECHLPVDPMKSDKILVVGDNAVRLHAGGGGSAEINALYEITPLMGIKMLLGGNNQVMFARGYEPKAKKESDHNWQEDSLNTHDALAVTSEDTGYDRDLAAEAVQMAAEADRVIFIGGLNHDFDIEGKDRSSLKLPYGQDRLILELLAANKNITVVMMSGSPVDMSAWKDKVKSLVWMSYAGMEGGRALADVLFGGISPSGHLAQTLPFEALKQFRTDELAGIDDAHREIFPGRALTEEEEKKMDAHLTQTYSEGRLVGYRYYDKWNIEVQYPFGFGLSYTKFEFIHTELITEEEKLKINKIPEDTPVAYAVVRVKNSGDREGKLPVQIYVGRKHPDRDEPVRELKSFNKVSLEAGEEKLITFPLTGMGLSHYDIQKGSFVIKPDIYEIYAGKDSRDLVKIDELKISREIVCV